MEEAAYRAGVLSLIKLKNPRTAAENQEDSKSSKQGPRKLGKLSPGDFYYPMQGRHRWPWNALPPEKAAEKKTTVFK